LGRVDGEKTVELEGGGRFGFIIWVGRKGEGEEKSDQRFFRKRGVGYGSTR